MIPKAKRDPSLFKNLRDIWLVPHGWKIVTACFSAEYKRVNAETQPHAAHGFRQLRNAAQASLVVKLQTEEAAILCQPLVRMYFDLEGFFMGVVRAVLLELEKRIGVFPEVTEAMQALQGEAQGRIITAHGATGGFPVPDGTGQGCKVGPDRALLTLLPVISMMNRNVQGHRLLTRGAAGREGIRQTWFADDSTFYPIDPFMGQMCADVMDIYSWMSGNRVAVNQEATKSAFAAATCDAEEGLHSVAARYRMHFPREQEVALPPPGQGGLHHARSRGRREGGGRQHSTAGRDQVRDGHPTHLLGRRRGPPHPRTLLRRNNLRHGILLWPDRAPVVGGLRADRGGQT